MEKRKINQFDKDGHRHGMWVQKEIIQRGENKIISNYSHGQYHGSYQFYYNKMIVRKGYFTHDKPDGLCLYYYDYSKLSYMSYTIR